ncbi:LytR/AlgR family response regulator transcription factor [Anaerostipes sp.]|uniref:LytR/AlgR family response regulator transcription factor n=1 Tax=Anaerostipes sp. TaxID=1872530 RepID=UPI0025BFEC66|nr:LytTR family DNA-binding domain-containing protein [Anaerostipes sp.]MBS7009748.1 response regulator transcription factor [Anaerostipes sp.]
MPNIAICDDDPRDLDTITEFLNDYAELHPDLDIFFDQYLSPCDLLENIRTKHYDIYLLDILMPSFGGIEVGQSIRKRDNSCAIIYLTNSPDFAVDSYDVKAQSYLLKPLDKDRLFAVLTDIMDEMDLDIRNHFAVRTKNGLEILPFGSLVSVEYYKHRLYCRLKDRGLLESITVRNSFDELSKPLLADNRFLKISASVIINMNYIRIVGSKSMTLWDGTKFSVTRTYKNARETYIDYMLKKGRIFL